MEKESLPQKIDQEKREDPRLWQVSIDQKGEIVGLPEGVSEDKIILFKKSDGNWWAANPSKEILKEIRVWRTDWMQKQ